MEVKMKNSWRVVNSRIERIVRKIKKLENKLIGLRQNNFKLIW